MTLPRGWHWMSLQDAAEVTLGQSPPGDSYNVSGEGVAFFQGKAEFTDTYAKVRKFTTAGTKFATAGDILISVRAPVGPTNIAPMDCAIGRGLAALRARAGLDQRYLLWALRASETILAAHGAGSTFPAITGSQLKAHMVPIPSAVDEQRRIVAILEDHLSRLDAAGADLATAQSRLLAFDRACLEKHFGARGATVGLGDLVTDISAGKSFGGAAAPAREDEWGIIKVSAMTWGEFRPGENKAVARDRVDERYEIREGDLLVSRANTSDYVGASVLVDKVRPKLLLSDKSLRLTPREGVDARWLWRALQAPSARRQISALATGTKDSMRNISQSSLRAVKLPKSSSEEQATALESYESVTDSLAAAGTMLADQRQRSAALRHSLLAAAFSGRLTRSAEDLSDVEEMIGA